jgi:alcohol dehydrogenase YqhD (iron-dependent ADH family)
MEVIMRYEVQTRFYGDTWENVWKSGDIKETYDTFDDAVDAIREHIIDCINAVGGGHMEDSPEQDSFRIVAGGDIYTWAGSAWDYTRVETV